MAFPPYTKYRGREGNRFTNTLNTDDISKVYIYALMHSDLEMLDGKLSAQSGRAHADALQAYQRPDSDTTKYYTPTDVAPTT